MTPETHTALRAAVEHVLGLPDLTSAERTDLIVAKVERLVPTDAPSEADPIVGVEYIAQRLGVRPSRAYDLAARLPGRVDLGDTRVRFNRRVLDEALAGDRALPKRRGARR